MVYEPVEKEGTPVNAYTSPVRDPPVAGSWRHHPILRYATTVAYNKLCQDYALCEKDIDNHQEDILEITTKLSQMLRVLMIRRTDSSRWFNEPIIPSVPHEERDVMCPHPPHVYGPDRERINTQMQRAWNAQVIEAGRRWDAMDPTERSGPRPTPNMMSLKAIAHKMRIIDSVPGFARLVVRDKNTLTADHVSTDAKRHPSRSAYAGDLDILMASSGKILKLRQIIDSLNMDVDGKKEKLVIVSGCPIVAYVIYLVCYHTFIPIIY